MHESIHGLRFRSMLGYETITLGCDVDAGEGGDQLALKDARSDSIGYLGGRVRCFLRGGKEVLFLRQVQKFMEASTSVSAANVFEDNKGAIKLATNELASCRAKTERPEKAG